MTKKYPKSDAISDQSLEGEEAYVTWGDDLSSKQEALSKSSGVILNILLLSIQDQDDEV